MSIVYNVVMFMVAIICAGLVIMFCDYIAAKISLKYPHLDNKLLKLLILFILCLVGLICVLVNISNN